MCCAGLRDGNLAPAAGSLLGVRKASTVTKESTQKDANMITVELATYKPVQWKRVSQQVSPHLPRIHPTDNVACWLQVEEDEDFHYEPRIRRQKGHR